MEFAITAATKSFEADDSWLPRGARSFFVLGRARSRIEES